MDIIGTDPQSSAQQRCDELEKRLATLEGAVSFLQGAAALTLGLLSVDTRNVVVESLKRRAKPTGPQAAGYAAALELFMRESR
jgi:acyl-CoA hydrolase